jgi:hypothetical protein
MAEIELGDVVLARGRAGRFHAVVSGMRLGRLVVERCDGRPATPLSTQDVLMVYKKAGRPEGEPRTERLRPTAQLRLDLPGEGGAYT